MKSKFLSLLLLVCGVNLFSLGAHADLAELVLGYQGRVSVDDIVFEGTGHFKFALVSELGDETYWSNDGQSIDGSEPGTGIELPVIRGLYSIYLGDSSIPGMEPILPEIFQNTDLRLRVWFNDGNHGFQQLHPDSRLSAAPHSWHAAKADRAKTAVEAESVAAGSIGAAQLDPAFEADLARLSGGANFAGTVTAETFSGSFSGDGSAVTNIRVSSLESHGALKLTERTNIFAPGVSLAVGDMPDFVLATDLNGDSYVDLVSVNHMDDTLTVLLNNGDGTFAEGVTFLTEEGPFTLAAVDINGDGFVDLVGAHSSEEIVTVRFGDGLGSFGPVIKTRIDGWLMDMEVADFNGDGEFDLIISLYDDHSGLAVLPGNGDGTFAELTESRFIFNGSIADFKVKDIDGDGNPDLIVLNADDKTAMILVNDGSGAFAVTNVLDAGCDPALIEAADFSGNGHLDLMIVDDCDDTLQVLLNKGDGTFRAADPIEVFGAVVFLAADVTGDGISDLLTADPSRNRLMMLVGKGDGTFAEGVQVPAGSTPRSIVATDINQDNSLDLIVANFLTSSLTVLRNLNGERPMVMEYTGDGSGLTNLDASQLSGRISLDQLPFDVPLLGENFVLSDSLLSANIARLDADQVFVGINEFAHPENRFTGIFTGTFVGDGNELTGLHAKNLTGTVPDSNLSGNIARLDGDAAFAGTVTAATFSGSFSGDGSSLTDLQVSSLIRDFDRVVAWGANDEGQIDLPADLADVVAIAGGGLHTLALRSDGTVVGWGDHFFGQTDIPENAIDVKAIAAGFSHSLALRHDGTVIAWGDNDQGQIDVPADLANVTAIAAGYYHSLALLENGTVVAWGVADVSEDGYPDDGQAEIPVDLANVKAIAAQGLNSFALQEDGTVVAWGWNAAGQTDVPFDLTDVVAIQAGTMHMLALRADGTVVAWGDNEFGQTDLPSDLTDIVSIAAGQWHSLALRSDGKIVAWGRNDDDQSDVPGDLADVVSIAAGGYHSLAVRSPDRLKGPAEVVMNHSRNVTLKGSFSGDGSGLTNLEASNLVGTVSDSSLSGNVALLDADQTFTGIKNFTNPENSFNGTFIGDGSALTGIGVDSLLWETSVNSVVAWGRNTQEQLNVPSDLTDVVSVAAGGSHSVALRRDGTVIAWGSNEFGQASVPHGLTDVRSVAAGYDHSLALKNDGTVVAWGRSDQKDVPGTLNDVVAIAGGLWDSLALRSDGTVVVWGSNFFGERNIPEGLADVISIAAGSTHMLALRSDGTVVAWGSASNGRTDVPAGLTDVISIAGGQKHSLALQEDGTVVAWGANEKGQTDVPSDLENVVSIAAGIDYSVALRGDGTVVVWGSGAWRSGMDAPSGLSGVVSISAGSYHALAIKSERVVEPAAIVLNKAEGVTLSGTFTGDGSRLTGLDAGNLVGTVRDANLPSNIARLEEGILSDEYFGENIARLDADQTFTGINEFIHSGNVFVGDGSGLLNLNIDSLVQVERLSSVVGWGLDPYKISEVPDGLDNVVAISMGTDFVLALRSDGRVEAWGANLQATKVPADLDRVIAVAAGAAHALALREDGTVRSWGAGGFATEVPDGLTNVKAIDAGSFSSLALKEDGTVARWGSRMEMPSDLTDVVSIASGHFHEMALKADGTVAVWGQNDDGQLDVPAGLSDVVAIAAGYHHCLALQSDGTVVAWGLNDFGQTDVPAGLSDVVVIAAGFAHSLALKRDGTVVSWGFMAEEEVLDTLTDVVSIVAGNFCSFAIQAEGGRKHPVEVVLNHAEGVTLSGTFSGDGAALTNLDAGNLIGILPHDRLPDLDASRIANGILDDARLGENIARLEGGIVPDEHLNENIARLDAEQAFTGINEFSHPENRFAGDGSGLANINIDSLVQGGVVTSIVGWGSNEFGKTEIPSDLDPNELVSLVAGPHHSLAALSDGTVVAWGISGEHYLNYGQAEVPAGLKDVVSVAAGLRFSYVLKSDGTVVTWGAGLSEVPSGLSGVKSIASGSDHLLALKEDGTVVMWGAIGIGEVPSGLTDVKAISAAGKLSLALKTDGTVVAWGSNYYGQADVPPGLTDVVSVAAAYDHALALKADGTVVAWGNFGSGRTAVPAGLTNVTAIAAGSDYSLALKEDGTVVAWGGNESGQTDLPDDLANVVAIIGGSTNGFAIRQDGAPLKPAEVVLNHAEDVTLSGLFSGTFDGTVNGVVHTTSDRAAKTDFGEIDSAVVLEKVAGLPITTWSYKDAPGIRHIGPMAQDFYAAFGFGKDERHIAAVDADGVALAAIQALKRENEELRRRIERLEEIIVNLVGEVETP